MPRTPDAAGRWLDAHLYRFDGPGQFLGNEPGSQLARCGGDRDALWESAAVRWLSAASWSYSQAAGNIAIPAVNNAITSAGPYLADRFYLPATPRDWDMLTSAGLGVFGIETRRPARDFDVFATSISYTVLFQNFCAYLMASGIPLRRADRQADPGAWPMVMAGGQAYCAPEFMSPVLDCVWLGEAEDEEGESGGIGEVCEVIASFKADGSWRRDRAGCYERLARRFSHLYFPQFTRFSYRYEDRGLPYPVKLVAGHWPVLDGMRYPHRRRIVRDLDKIRPLTRAPMLYTDPGMGAGDTEVARGCTCWCSFCRLGLVTKPYRQHSVDYVIAQAQEWRRNMGSVDISLVAPDPPVYTQKKELLARILTDVTDEVDMSSGRVDDYEADSGFALLLSVGGADSLTLGLEGGSQRMRDLAGKGTTDDDVCAVVTRAIRAGIRRIKLYMITNWPGEDEHDVMSIVELGRRLADIRDSFGEAARSVRIQFSWTPLLIEAATPLQWFAVTVPDYRLQAALDMLRDLNIHMKIGAKANPDKLAFFQACQRASRSAGEALVDVIEGIGLPSWGGFPRDMRNRLDAALIAHGFLNGLEDLFGERYEHDLLGWEHIDTGVSRKLLWRAYRDMVEFLTWTDASTYDDLPRGEARGNEWIDRCDHSCQGAACGACSRKDFRLRREYIEAGTRDRDIEADPPEPVDHTTVSRRLRLRVRRPAAYRFASAEFLRFHVRAAAFRACEATGFPPIAKRTVALASDATSYRDRSAGLDYAEFGVTAPVTAGPSLEAFLDALGRELAPWLELEACQVLAASAKMPSRPAGYWELETGLGEVELAALLRKWDAADRVRFLRKTDSFYAGAQTEWINAKDHVTDLWAAVDGTRIVLRMLLGGKLGPYQVAQALLGKNTWMELAAWPAVRLGFFRPGQEAGVLACTGCGGPVPEGLLGEPFDDSCCPRCLDGARGQIVAGLSRAGVLQGAEFFTPWGGTCGSTKQPHVLAYVRHRPGRLGRARLHAAERGVRGRPCRRRRRRVSQAGVEDESRPCPFTTSAGPCPGRLEPDLDGELVVWTCTACGSEDYGQRLPQAAGTCQMGLPAEMQQTAPPGGGTTFLGPTIGRRPQ